MGYGMTRAEKATVAGLILQVVVGLMLGGVTLWVLFRMAWALERLARCSAEWNY
jgi:hypothetical protein